MKQISLYFNKYGISFPVRIRLKETGPQRRPGRAGRWSWGAGAVEKALLAKWLQDGGCWAQFGVVLQGGGRASPWQRSSPVSSMEGS